MSVKAHGFKFYTYVHIRNDIGEVFYVGKGTGRRAFALGRNPYWNSIVAKHGHAVHIVAYFANEADAFEHEKEMISELRASGFNLANMTDGGEGATGWVPPASTRAKHADITRRRMADPAARTKLAEKAKAQFASQEARAKHAESVKAGWAASPDTRARMSSAQKGRTGRPHTDEERARMSLAAKGSRKVPWTAERKAAASAARKGCKQIPWSDESKARLSATITGRKVSDETRRLISAVKKANFAKRKLNEVEA